jgi:acetylcholinesterase
MLPLEWAPSSSLNVVSTVVKYGKMILLTTCQHLAIASAIFSSLSTARAASEVNLSGYGSFIGTTVNQTLTKKPLPAPVDAWLGIDYAAQPIGVGRFAPAGPPATFTGTKNATKYGYSCVQDPATISYEQDEACLSMNVFRPQNISSTDKLPVLIWIHGVSHSSDSRYSHANQDRAHL